MPDAYLFMPNHLCDFKHTLTSISITGTSIRTPTTVANAAPDDNPNSVTDVAMATSKWLEAPMRTVCRKRGTAIHTTVSGLADRLRLDWRSFFSLPLVFPALLGIR
jgi:hypothetical protein